MSRGSDKKLYQFVDALVATGVAELVKTLKLDEEKARDVMRDVAHSICFQYARSYMYVPADLQFELGKRDEEIWRKYGEPGPAGVRPFSPQRVAQLAEEHTLTTVRIYSIVKAMMQRDLAARQGTLDGL
jgi:hypothetical protein